MSQAITPDTPAKSSPPGGSPEARVAADGCGTGPPDLAPPQLAPHRGASVSRWRFVRAYTTTFAVIASYLWLSTRARFFGRTWRDANIGVTHQNNARRVYATILRLQGLFIKVGQLLSIMANFLPQEFRAELEALQDQVPPRPYGEIAETLESELGGRMKQLRSLEREPIASASLGQVHVAELVDGQRVCVKVQHRDIDRIVRLDLKTIRRIMQIVQFFVPVQGLDAYYHQIQRAPDAGARLRARGRQHRADREELHRATRASSSRGPSARCAPGASSRRRSSRG